MTEKIKKKNLVNSVLCSQVETPDSTLNSVKTELEEQNELYEHYRFIADKGQKIVRIDKFLVNHIDVSRTKIQAAASAGNILINGKAVKSNNKVKPDDVISIVLPYPQRETEIIPQNIPIDIEYEDEALLVVNKKAGMVVHPSFGHYEGTLINALTYYLKDLPLFSSGEMRPGLVHRLDKNTSGLIVIAKTEIALNKLAKQFFNKSVEKKYIALVWGNIEEEQGTITGHIGRSLKNRKIMHVFTDGSYGKHAITHYKVLERLGYVNLVECKPETGRTHQIRVHFQHIKHPLFNDESYGGDRILRGNTFTKYKQFVQNCFKLLPRHALHAKSLGFIHPASDKYISFDSELPDDMKKTIDKWRNYSIDY